MSAKLLGPACIAVLCITLSLGLWPFHAPKNDVAGLGTCDGLHFGRYGTAIGTDAFRKPNAFGSLEIWLQPRNLLGFGTLLGFSVPGRPCPFYMQQSLADLKLQTSRAGALYVADVFRQGRPTFLTITSGIQGTRIYIDGALTRSAPWFRISAAQLTGRLVVGNPPGEQNAWHGDLFGLAMYRRELTAPEVLRQYRAWTQNGCPDLQPDEGAIAVYRLNERRGNLVHSQTGCGAELCIPYRFVVLDHMFLEPFWHEFRMSRSYWGDVLKNIVGFMPWGFCVFAYLSARRVRRAVLFTVLSGTAVSLMIEVLQTFLPTRDSGMTDLITNTFGTWIGIASYKFLRPMLNRT